MRINCDRCDNEMFETGAIVFGPPFILPDGSRSLVSEKLHLCRERCWPIVREAVLGIVIVDD